MEFIRPYRVTQSGSFASTCSSSSSDDEEDEYYYYSSSYDEDVSDSGDEDDDAGSDSHDSSEPSSEEETQFKMDASEGEIRRNLTAINDPYTEKRCWACRSLAEMVEDENSRIFCDAQCWQQYYTLAKNQLAKKNKPVKPPKPKLGGITKPSKLKKTTKPPPVKVPEKPPIKEPEKPKPVAPQPEKPVVKAPEKPKAVKVPKKKPFNKAPKKPKVVTPPPVKVPEKQPSPPIKEPEKPVVAKQEASNTSASESASSRKLKKPLPYQRKGRRSQRRSKNPLPSYFGDEQKKKAKQSADGSQSKGSESTTKDKKKEPSGGSPPVVAKDPTTKKKDKKPSDGSQSKDPAKKDKSKKKPSPSDASGSKDPTKKDKSKPSDASESKDPDKKKKKKKKKDKQEPVVKPEEPTREQRLQDKYDRAKGRRKDAEQRAQEERESRIRAEAAAEAAAQRDNGGGASSGGGFYLPDNSDRSYTLPNGGGGRSDIVPINPVPVVTRRTEIVQDDRRVTPQPPPFSLPEPRRKPGEDDAGTVITEQVGDDDGGKMRETIIEDPVVPVRPRNDIITRKPSKSIDKTRRMKKNNRYSEFGVRDEEYWKQPNGFGYGLWWHRRYPWISRYVSFAKFFPQKWRPYYILSDDQNIATYEYGDPIDQENVLIDEDLFAGAIVPPLATFAQLGVDSEILHMPVPYRNKLRTEERMAIRAALRLIECEILRMRGDIDLLSYSYQGYTPVPDFDRESMVWVKRV